MQGKSRVYIFVTLTLMVGISACSIFLYAASQHRKAFDELEVANAKFRMRVTAYDEVAPFALPGARYVFQSAPLTSTAWIDVLTVKADQAAPIPRNQIRFVSNEIGYFFIDNYYTVTTDGGRTWFVWDANKELPVRQFIKDYNLWPAIKEIHLDSTGAGRMTLYQYLSEREKGPELFTLDFGRHWALK